MGGRSLQECRRCGKWYKVRIFWLAIASGNLDHRWAFPGDAMKTKERESRKKIRFKNGVWSVRGKK